MGNLLKGKTRRQVLLNLTSKQVDKLAEELNCSRLLVTIEDELYKLTIGANLRSYKHKIVELLNK